MTADTSCNKVLAVIYASLAAGPIAIVAAGMGFLISGAPVGVALDPSLIAPVVGYGLVLCVTATVFAIIPNIAGVTAMAWLASRNVGMRHPAMWMLVGGAATGVPAWLALYVDVDNAPIVLWGTIGALSALVARLTVRWEQMPSA